MLSSSFIVTAYRNACLAELEAIKPGNVHIFADGHGMEVQHFVESAEASAPYIVMPNLTLGERIYKAVEATYNEVQCNTNLGIVMLCAPIVHALSMPSDLPLQSQITQIIADTTVQDAEWLYQAIRLAKPAGIGQRQSDDVAESAKINLAQAMQVAKNYDMIAQQYSQSYEDVFNKALPVYQALVKRWERPAWATTGVYLFWLAHYADSHIMRKYGQEVAQTVLKQALIHYQTYIRLDNPKTYLPALLAWDAQLKAQAINPGTSADLTVTTILLAGLENVSF